MKVLFVWTGVASYMADCWRVLANSEGVELKVVIADRPGGYGTAFRDDEVMRGIDWHRESAFTGVETFAGWRPDIMFIVGWREPVCRAYATCRDWRDVPKVCCFDMPWEWKLRKIAARFVLASYLRNFKAAFVPGEIAARYARWLGFKRIYRGLFGIDVNRMRGSFDCTQARRTNFLFVGRLSDEKRIDVLASAYRAYRQSVQDPVGLDVYGVGRCESLLRGIPGVVMHGFAQPADMPGIYARAKALLLPSVWDPWPLVIAESCAAGLPIVCSNHCWNAPELMRGNAHIVPVGDVHAMVRAMSDVDSLDGSAGWSLVANYSCESWAQKVRKMCLENF